MEEVKQVTIFVSSAKELQSDRDLVANTIKEIGKTSTKYHFKIFEFRDVAPEFGAHPQVIINKRLPKFDIYIGLMGDRFGSSTERYGSGTEEEFRDALLLKKKDDRIHVSLMFKITDTQLHSLNAEQLTQFQEVRSFQQNISSEGVYRDYKTPDDLAGLTRSIINTFITNEENLAAAENHQSVAIKTDSTATFKISNEYFTTVLNSIGADLTNGYRENMQLDDVYIPLDVADVKGNTSSNMDGVDETKSTLQFDHPLETQEAKLFIIGDESAGKTALCKRIFLNFHSCGYVPVYIHGSELRAASENSVRSVIEKALATQYETLSVTSYRSIPKEKKLIIVDDLDESTLNDKYKINVLQYMESFASNIICTADDIFFINLGISYPAELENLSHFKAHKLKDMGQSLRDDLIQKWTKVGREETITDKELYNETEKYRNTVDEVLGANFVARKPLIVLILLQAINGGTTAEFTHGSFVRYYRYLIDTTLLQNIPKAKIELYYAFLPSIAHAIFTQPSRTISKLAFDELIETFCRTKGLHVHDLLAVQSNLVALKVLEAAADVFRFRHSFVYYYFLAQYFSDNITDQHIADKIREICQKLHLRENANIIIFLSYHTRDSLVIDTILSVANSLFAGIEPFDFTAKGTQKLNQLIEEAPKLLVSPDAEKERKRRLQAIDQKDSSIKDREDVLDPTKLSAQLNISLRSMEIMGQLLKNHYAKFDAAPKRDLYLASSGVALRVLSVLMSFLTDDLDILAAMIRQRAPNSDSEKAAKKAIFSLATWMTVTFIRANSKFTGAETLSRTYEDVLEHHKSTIFEILDLAIKLDFVDNFPMRELQDLAKKCCDDKLAMTVLRRLVLNRIYMRPIKDFKERQQICDAVGLTMAKQITIEQKGAA